MTWPVTVTSDDIQDALGVPYATVEDEAAAANAAVAASAYVNGLDIIDNYEARDQVAYGAIRLATRLFHTRPTGDLQIEGFDPTTITGIDPLTSRMLQIGAFARPVVA